MKIDGYRLKQVQKLQRYKFGHKIDVATDSWQTEYSIEYNKED